MLWAWICGISLFVIGAIMCVLIGKLFFKSTDVPPMPPVTTTTVLPAEGITKTDVDSIRFAQVVHGYKISEVDWVLERLGLELEQLREELALYQGSERDY